MVNDPVNEIDPDGLMPIEGIGTTSRGLTGNPISGGNISRTSNEQLANKAFSKIAEKLTNRAIKINPLTGRFVPNPIGVAISEVLPKNTAECQTLSCDLDRDGLDDNAMKDGICKPGLN